MYLKGFLCPQLIAGAGLNLGGNEFGDLLNAHGFASKKDQGPVTLKDMKKKEEIAHASDPDKVKVRVVYSISDTPAVKL